MWELLGFRVCLRAVLIGCEQFLCTQILFTLTVLACILMDGKWFDDECVVLAVLSTLPPINE